MSTDILVEVPQPEVSVDIAQVVVEIALAGPGGGETVAAHEAKPDPHPQYLTDAHLAESDPHPQYLTGAEGDAAYADINHTHPSTSDFQYNYDSISTMADPGPGKVRTDTAAGVPSTQIAFDNITNLGIDASATFATLLPNDIVQFQQLDDSNNWGHYVLTAPPVNNDGWWLFNVQGAEFHGDPIAKNKTVLCKFTYGGGGGGGGWLGKGQADTLYVNATGDTMTGPLHLAADPVDPDEAATKNYVDALEARIALLEAGL